MFHQRLTLASVLCVAACAQIAGFDQLSSNSETAGGGGGSAASAGTASPGNGDGGALSGKGPGGSSNSGAHSHAGNGGGALGSAGAPGSAGNGGAQGSAGAPGSAGNGGALGNAGNGGNFASGGSAPAAGGSTVTAAGSAGVAPVAACNAELLSNGDFDAGPVAWRQESKAPGILALSDVIIEDTNLALARAQVAPRSGNYLAWLGGVLDSDKGSHVTLVQDVQIPLKVSRLVLSGWIQIKTTEPDPENTTDQLDLTLQDDNNYWSFHFWKGTDAVPVWTSFSYPIADGAELDELRGRTLTFYAQASADTSEVTSYWLDSLSLFAECPR